LRDHFDPDRGGKADRKGPPNSPREVGLPVVSAAWWTSRTGKDSAFGGDQKLGDLLVRTGWLCERASPFDAQFAVD